MNKIAIIGTGISGLSAAYLLQQRHAVTVYERQDRLGGHSRTLNVSYGDRKIAVDTGFIVFNERNYPNLTALFRHLGVPIKNSDMSFALTVADGWLEWGAKDLAAIIAQRRNLLRPRFLKLFADVLRFNRDAVREVEAAPDLSVDGLIRRMGLGDWFRRHYLLPMAGAIWSCPPRQMLKFPASSLIHFFANHNLMSFSGQPQWLTVDGGAQIYVDRMASLLGDRVRIDSGAVRVRRQYGHVEITDTRGEKEVYDNVVFACPSDQAEALLGSDATTAERDALGAIRYQANVAVLHKDPSFMPKRKACWASWVYHSDGVGDFVTLNPAKPIAPADVFDVHECAHPVFDFGALAAQQALKAMQGVKNTYFCGAYLGHGFHEDGLVSAMRVAEQLGVRAPWAKDVGTIPRSAAPNRLPPFAEAVFALGD
jgi:uncharacterized protein